MKRLVLSMALAAATTRREPESTASAGTSANQTATKDPSPPDKAATSATMPVSAAAENRWAVR